MLLHAEDYRWSSAAAHCGKRTDGLINPESTWSKEFPSREEWPAYLAEGEISETIQILRKNVEKGLPCGTENFIKWLGNLAGREAEYRPQGRPRKT
jgi:putative transposase